MFGLNDEEKTRDDQQKDQGGPQAHHDEHTDKSISDSPFAAAYSSMSVDDDADSPVPARSRQVSTVPEEDLLQIKTQALQSLAPLVGHLDQSPEEKFRTTMMMIQAADNQALIKDAYEAANAIPDEKTRAQALLDIINEINYFTQHQEDK